MGRAGNAPCGQPSITFTTEDGDLAIVLTPEGQEEIGRAIAQGQNIDSEQFMCDLFEHPLCNGWEWIRPEEIAALTDAPIVSDRTERDEDGTLVKIGRVYWFPSYQIESPVQTLYDAGRVIFTGVA